MNGRGAVAVDFGATSGRFAAGQLVDGRIEFEVIEQIPHSPIERNGRLEWDIDLLMGLVATGSRLHIRSLFACDARDRLVGSGSRIH